MKKRSNVCGLNPETDFPHENKTEHSGHGTFF